ncbi:adenosine kinase [Candidatus Woesearchaeota archaeon]|jgi:sugar/nucleoside kinase (ribokinase family)|nr:adenosine kinase [Candidatus Woesearchaeota archaeon]
MTEKTIDVIGIGNPLLDLTINTNDNLLETLNLPKGGMHLVDSQKSNSILNSIQTLNPETSAGGSTANTLSGVCNFGGSSILIGKIGTDSNGEIYEQITIKHKTESRLSKHSSIPTGTAITFITPDKERTFATHLGAALKLTKEDIFEPDIQKSKILHIEGFQLEDSSLKETSIHAMEFAKKHNTLISIDLADAGLIKRNLEDLKNLTKKYANIIFANETEAQAFTNKSDEQESLIALSEFCDIAIVKIGKNGSLIKTKESPEIIIIPPHKTQIINTNGAGDMFAGGFLFSIAKNISPQVAGNIASFAAAQVVASPSARLNRNLQEEIKQFY